MFETLFTTNSNGKQQSTASPTVPSQPTVTPQPHGNGLFSNVFSSNSTQQVNPFTNQNQALDSLSQPKVIQKPSTSVGKTTSQNFFQSAGSFLSNLFGGAEKTVSNVVNSPQVKGVEKTAGNLLNTGVSDFYHTVLSGQSGSAINAVTSFPIVGIPGMKNTFSLNDTKNIIDQIFKLPDEGITAAKNAIYNSSENIQSGKGNIGDKIINAIAKGGAAINNLNLTMQNNQPAETSLGGLYGTEWRGIQEGITSQYLGDSKKVMDTFSTPLDHPVTTGGKVSHTVGDVVGNVLAFIAGGEVLKAAGLGKATMPVLFAALGQTSSPSTTTALQRIEKAPVDAIAGWLFGNMKAPSGVKEAVTQTAKAGTVMGGQQFINSVIAGQKGTDAAKTAGTMFAIGALFHVAGSATGLIGSKLLDSQFKQGVIDMSPQEVQHQVMNTDFKGTPQGEALMKASLDAQAQGKNIRINMTAAKKAPLANALHLRTPSGISFTAELVDAPAQIQQGETPKTTNGSSDNSGNIPSTAAVESGAIPVKSEFSQSPGTTPLPHQNNDSTPSLEAKLANDPFASRSGGEGEQKVVPPEIVKPAENSQMTPIKDLVSNKVEPEQSLANAKQYIAEAQSGQREARDPITVKTNADGTKTIVDGNATYQVLRDAGYTHIPTVAGDNQESGLPLRTTSTGGKETPLADLAVTSPLREETVTTAPSNKYRFGVTKIEDVLRDKDFIAKYHYTISERKSLEAILHKVAESRGIIVSEKKIETAASKIVGKLKRNPGYTEKNVNDLLRSTIIADNAEDKHVVLHNLNTHANVIEEVHHTKDTNAWGYEGINTTIKTAKGNLNEVQIHTREELYMDKMLHPFYEKWRREKEVPESVFEQSKQIAEQARSDYQESVDLIRQAMYTGDSAAAKNFHETFLKEGMPLAKFDDIQKEVEQLLVQSKNEIAKIQRELNEGDMSTNPDDPTNQLKQIARQLQDHFSRPYAKFKITGTERTYKSADGATMLVGGNASQAFDRLIHATDIEGFSKNIKIFHEKFDGVFTGMYDSIRSGSIDSADYEQFRKYFDSIQDKRLSAVRKGGEAQSNQATVKSSLNTASGNTIQNGTESSPAETSQALNQNDRADEVANTSESTTEPSQSEHGNSSSPESARVQLAGEREREQTDRTARNGERIDIGEPEGKEPVPSRASVQLNAGIDPGLKQFFEGEIAPAYQAVRAVGKEWNEHINPPKASEKAAKAANAIREAKAKIANYRSVVQQQLDPMRKLFNKYSDVQNIKNISHYEKTGEWSVEPKSSKPFKVTNPESNKVTTYRSFNEFYREANNAAYQVLSAAYGKTPESYVENYVRRMFVFGSSADEAKGTTYLTNAMRSLSGSKSPLKHRVLDMPLDEALANMKKREIQVKPATTNPIELLEWNMVNAQRAIAYRQAWNEAKESKLIAFVPRGSQIPEGFIRLNDRAAEIFAPAELHFPNGHDENGLTFQDKGYQSTVAMGTYYADPNVARVFNNAISSGLEGSATFRGIRFISNSMNQFQLAISGFHFTAVSIDAGVTDLSIGLRYMLSGKPIQSMQHIGTGVVPFASFFKDLYNGHSLLEGLKNDSPDAYKFLETRLNPAGGRLGQDARYRNEAWSKITHALTNNNPIGAVVRTGFYLPPALIEMVAHPLINFSVPRVKLGAFMDLAELRLSQLPKDATNHQRKQVLVSAWTSIDNRMGQLVYDNLFWHKAGKDVAMLATRSVGWNLGTVRELGGAVVDSAGTIRGKGISDRMLWGASLVMYVALLSSIYMYLHTGQMPKELKDYFHPKNGLTDKNGNPDRVNFPSYMKDVFAYIKDPLGTVLNKTSPFIDTIASLVGNKDYYGNLIRNPNDPTGTQLSQVGEYILQNILPFSLQQFNNQLKLGANPEQLAESFFGIIKAPQSVIQSDKQKAVLKAYQNQVGLPAPKTPEQVQIQNLKNQARDEIQKNGWQNSAAFKQLLQNGTLKTQLQRRDFIKSAGLTAQQRMLQHIPKATRRQFINAAQ